MFFFVLFSTSLSNIQVNSYGAHVPNITKTLVCNKSHSIFSLKIVQIYIQHMCLHQSFLKSMLKNRFKIQTNAMAVFQNSQQSCFKTCMDTVLLLANIMFIIFFFNHSYLLYPAKFIIIHSHWFIYLIETLPTSKFRVKRKAPSMEHCKHSALTIPTASLSPCFYKQHWKTLKFSFFHANKFTHTKFITIE